MAEFGLGDNPATTIDGGSPGRRPITTYFRHTLDVADPSFCRSVVLRLKRADGAVVYLNGKELYRVSLPTGAVNTRTLATRGVSGLEEDVFFPVTLQQPPDGAAVKAGKASRLIMPCCLGGSSWIVA